MDRLKNGCIVCNMGHSNTEIDVVCPFCVYHFSFFRTNTKITVEYELLEED